MTKLSVNINKIATLRNARGGNVPNVVKMAMENPQATQQEMAKELSVTQGRISEALSRAGFDQIMKMNHLYQKLIQPKIQ